MCKNKTSNFKYSVLLFYLTEQLRGQREPDAYPTDYTASSRTFVLRKLPRPDGKSMQIWEQNEGGLGSFSRLFAGSLRSRLMRATKPAEERHCSLFLF